MWVPAAGALQVPGADWISRLETDRGPAAAGMVGATGIEPVTPTMSR